MAVSGRKAKSERLKAMLDNSRNGTHMKNRDALGKKLKQKLYEEYSTKLGKNKVKELKDQISYDVEHMFRKCTRAKVTEKHLKQLEDGIRDFSLRLEEEEANAVDDINYRNASESKTTESKVNIPDDNYQVFSEADFIEHNMEIQKNKVEVRNKQRQMKKFLDEQMNEARERSNAEKQEQINFAKQQQEEVERYERDEKAKNDRERRKMVRDKELRQQQLDIRNKKIEKMKRLRKAEEEELVRNCQRELQKDEEQRQAKIREQKMYMLKVKKENEILKKEREIQRQKQWEDDKRRAKEYEEKLEREEQERAENLKKLQEKSSQNQKNFMVATKQARDKEEADLERNRQHNLRKMEEDDRLAAEREQRRKDDNDLMKKTLAEQVRARKKAMQEEEEHAEALAKQARIEAQDAIEAEKKFQQKKRIEARQHRAEIEKQIQEQRKIKQDLDSATKISRLEKRMNAERFRQIKNNGTLSKLIMQNMKPHPRDVAARKRQEKSKTMAIRSDYYS